MIDESWKETPEGVRARTAAAEHFMVCLKLLGQDMPEEAARCVARMRWHDEAARAGVPNAVLERTEDLLGIAIDMIDAGKQEQLLDLLLEIMELWY